jgi:3-dehydroquinate synthase
MEKISASVKRNDYNYQIYLGSGILNDAAKHIQKNHPDKKLVIITDDSVGKICGNKIKDSFSELEPYVISLPAGEKTKSRETKNKVEDILLGKNYGRDTLIVAIGGGVIGDLSGYIASTYNRGIPIIHIPTTLLAMVDSSIGGKTGVNTRHGKNIIGSIWQPDAVFADMDFLKTLPKEEFLNGMAEIIKMSIILDKGLFSYIGDNVDKILDKNKDELQHIISRSIELKKDVIEKDEAEAGLRQKLNFGHTVGHALENHYDYKKKHGLCVSLGMAAESKISVLSGLLQEEEQSRIISLLEAFGLPTKIENKVENSKIVSLMKIDKKSRVQKPHFVMINGIGQVKSENGKYSFEVSEEIIINSIEKSK